MTNIFLKEILIASTLGSVLFIFVICMKQLFKRIVDITVSYKLWFLMIFCLLIPFIPIKIPDFIHYNIPGAPVESYSNIVNNITTIEVVQLAKAHVDTNNEGIKQIFNFDSNVYIAIWLCGVIAYLIYMCVINYKIRKIIVESKHDIDDDTFEVFRKCKHQMGISEDISIVSVEAIEQPCIYGFFKPVILLSNKCIKKLSNSQKNYIFVHELSHYLRKDHLTNWLLIALKIVYWFNPIIGYAMKKMKEDSELACDALALSYINSKEYQRYAMTIVDLLDIVIKTKYSLTTVSIINGRKRIERRISMIYDFKNCTKLKKLISLLVVLLIASVGVIPIYAFNHIEKKMEDSMASKITNESDSEIDTIQQMSFTWPVPNYKKITSTYGLRFHPLYYTNEDDKEVKTTYEECEIGNIKVLEPKIEQDTLNNGIAFHNGIDIAAPVDEKIVATEAGTIIYCGFTDKYGNMIIIKHGEENYSIYAHCSKLLVKESQEVTKGAEIAKVGSTGQSTGPHLHFSIVVNNKMENPLEYLDVEEM
ncbi:MAG: M56 family metallopeptidase [Anaerovorax sp.]|nr:M56 family metallopeptidase [Anaerovorax sp.]